MSNGSSGSILTGILALFAGCGTMLRMCSKADDVARLGKVANYADDARGLRHLDDAGNLRYGDDVLRTSRNASRLNNSMSGEDFARAINESITDRQAASVIEDFHETYLLKSEPGFRKEMNALSKDTRLKADPYEYALAKEELLMKYGSESSTLARENTFRTIKTTFKLTNKLFDYATNLQDILDLYNIIGEDSVARIQDFEVTLPKGALVAKDSVRIVWADNVNVNQVTVIESFDINKFIREKTNPTGNSSSWTTHVKDFQMGDNNIFSFGQGYLKVFGRYETITRDNETILIESMSSDSLAPSIHVDKIVKALIDL